MQEILKKKRIEKRPKKIMICLSNTQIKKSQRKRVEIRDKYLRKVARDLVSSECCQRSSVSGGPAERELVSVFRERYMNVCS